MKRTKASDLAAVARISAVPSILQVIVETTGLRFAAVARVTEDSWTACAVLDQINFGLAVGGELEVSTTLCHEIQASHRPIVISKVSDDCTYANHHTPRLYGFESYISAPVFRSDGSFFGTLCALDPEPRDLSDPRILAMMESFCRLLAIQLEAEERFVATEAALLDARETAEVREQFIALLGHDLRNPLFSITAGAQLLLRRATEPRVEGIASNILMSGHRALRLVDDVLDLARGRLGNGIPLNLAWTDNLDHTLLHVVSEVQNANADRRFTTDIQVPVAVRCDPDRIAQLLSNLLANAASHGDAQTPIEVQVGIQEERLVITVANQGEPIAPEKLSLLFQPYWRPSDDGSKRGLGLGLFIVGEIARSHGAELRVSSSAEHGTRFTFDMPLQAPEA
ncbi:sensor histidine kinase [Stutzerimonas nosocomialis]|uniref:GAF domain-containing sensor histidine kinase n=1 Tax=Stutzerimonas nosocomialis TaxID=1056496 RepID=UPI001108925C|nr:GAF domain-containing sensor histidine kinase [Stutzerimonas nosocomialis]TLX60707.1 sensor histidine kinase [Stutzerimonas nosocomialis]